MYGLPQAGLLANKLLARRLAKYGYFQAEHTPGLWKHTWRPIKFALVVDDFGVEYAKKEHAQHLMDALNNHYEAVSEDWQGSLFCGFKLTWDYHQRTVDLSMPGYIQQALHKFQHPNPTKPQHSPHQHKEIKYGAQSQLTDPSDDSHYYRKRESNGYNKSSTHSCIMPERSISPCSSPSATYHPPNPKEPRQPTAPPPSCSIIAPPTLKHQSATAPAKWLCRFTATHPTYRSLKDAAQLADIYTSEPPQTPPNPCSTMASFSPSMAYSNTSCLPPLKQRSPDYSSTPKKAKSSTPLLMKWDIHKSPLRSKRTILLPVASRTTPSTNSAHAPSTCVSTGYMIV
jgi:hypothetical protein